MDIPTGNMTAVNTALFMKNGTALSIAFAMFALFPSAAESFNVLGATIENGQIRITGRGAPRRTAITWAGNSLGVKTKRNGTFDFVTTDRPLDCVGALTIGTETLDVTITNCNSMIIVSPYKAALPATGQMISYAAGDDGDLQRGLTVASPRFTLNVNPTDDTGVGGGVGGNHICDGAEVCNGTVTDNLTGLIWPVNGDCFGARTWSEALSDANNLAAGACGILDGSVAGDWRLPNVRELLSLVDFGDTNPTLPPEHRFTDFRSATYWSSTSAADSPADRAWFVAFNSGTIQSPPKSDARYVLPVRGGR